MEGKDKEFRRQEKELLSRNKGKEVVPYPD
jgi:hypothetical protein